MLLRHKPYHLLLLSFLVLFIAALLTKVFQIEFSFQDSYYAFPLTYFFWITALTLLINWLLYLFTQRLLPSKILMWVHIVVTIFSFIFIFAYPYLSLGFSEGLAGMPRRYYDYNDFNFSTYLGIFQTQSK